MASLPARDLTAVLCTVDLEKHDVELKLLLGCTPSQAAEILAIHNRGRQAAILVERGEAG